MLANWHQTIAELGVASRRRGIVLPDRYVANGCWHEAEAATGTYLMFAEYPFFALLDSAADDRGPELWQPRDRLLNFAQSRRIRKAIASRPRRTVRGDVAIAIGAAPRCGTPESGNSCSSANQPRIVGAARRAQTARLFVAELLQAGPMATMQVRASAAREGLSWATVRRAASTLGVRSTRHGFGRDGRWCWSLKDAQSTTEGSIELGKSTALAPQTVS